MTFESIETQVKNVQTLSELFQLWWEAHEADLNWEATFPKGIEAGAVEGFKSSFCIDGVSSLDGKYDGTEKADVLFVLKESNIGLEKLQQDGAIHPFWFNDQPSHPTRNKYTKNFKAVLDRYDPQREASAPIGYMNLNKRGGAGYTRAKRLKTYVKEYQNFILKEIELLSPNIIFLCGCGGIFSSVYHDFITQTPDGQKELALSNSAKPCIVSIYHPAYLRFDKCLDRVQAKPV